MKWVIASAVLFIATVIVSPGYTAGPPEQNIRDAYKLIVSQVDANKDGKALRNRMHGHLQGQEHGGEELHLLGRR